MELTIREKNATICLNMIVKNESHIIENTLEKLCKKISFDYWVICDTGSTDNTPQIITKFFEKMGIKGEIYYDEWRDFAHNRTLALQRAYGKTDLLLVFDADDEIVGNVIMPTEVLCDEYHMKFGSASGTSYTRVLLINNHKKFKFLSVLHEFITSIDGSTSSTIIEGHYYVVSGRTGSRSMDPNKYLKDALVLEKAHAEALKNDDHLFHRYAYYCANSYKDCNKLEDAIKWYKITLSQEKQWDQEKYTACLYIYDCYKAMNQETNGFFYLVKAFSYDKERVECLYPLLVHYCCENSHKVAYNYYLNVKDFFENHYLNADMSRKLFTITDKYNFFVPYYMILIADKVQDFECIIRMYEIVFIKKQPMFEEWYVKNFLYNLQFFLKHVPKDNKHFSKLANDYITFLFANGVKLQTFDFLNKDEYKSAGINLDNYTIKEVTLKTQKYSKNECAGSKNILIYTGFSDIQWNYTYMLNNALGGSEKAVAYISKCFPTDFNIFISGDVKNETIDNIQYIHLNELPNLFESTPFHTLIVSRYIGFYEMFQTCSFYQSFIWAHDTILIPYGCNLNETHILKKWNKYINGCVCLTEWHKTIFSEIYPELKNKITLINNGLDLTSFPTTDTNSNNILNNILNNKKIKNKFIYTSRPDRGLNILLQLWPQIIDIIPDATLTISTYGNFPSNVEEVTMKTVIDSTPSIYYLGKLNVEQLYLEMSTAEFWLYPTHWPETSCITALEMLMSEVICLYYPVAGLPFTIDKYGIQIKPGSEIEAIVSLTDEQKQNLRKNGREYAEQCSWSNRYKLWSNLLSFHQNTFTNVNANVNANVKCKKNIAIINSFIFHYEMYGYIIEYCKRNNYLLTIFTSPDNTLGWLEFYNSHFKNYTFEINNIYTFEKMKEQFDVIFVTTDDDYFVNPEWINDKYVSINHYYKIRRPEYKYNLATRPFIVNFRDWAIPCFNILEKNDKENTLNKDINISIIGGLNYYNYDTINRLNSSSSINLYIISRNSVYFNTLKITNNKIKTILLNNIDTIEMITFLKKCDYILVDATYNIDHINGVSMSGSIPLAFSTLTPIIISKKNNSLYNFKNVIEFDMETNDKIIVEKGKINTDLLVEERNRLIYMLDDFMEKRVIINKHTALIVDPRDDDVITNLIQDFKQKLGDKWIIVFYCGKGLKEKMTKTLDTSIEVRELDINNFTINEYSDFMKTKELWETLYGEFVLTFQLDTYIVNEPPYTIDCFINMNKSYIGGNMDHEWNELTREQIYSNYRNFNGGLSLRKRLDMIKIIDTFGTEKTEDYSQKIQTDPEDVYFTIGCFKLNLPLGDTKECMHFCINRIWLKEFFGLHKPRPEILHNSKELSKLYCNNTNRFILTPSQPNKIIDCFTFYNELNMLNYRLNVLDDVVDYFILVEAKQTHVGKPKKLFYDENKEMFEKFNDKIIHIIVDLPFNETNINISNGDQWTNEKFQRNCIQQGLEKIKHKLNDGDHIVIADVDEIPDPKTLLKIKNKNINNDINVLEQEFYYYNLNSKRNEYWYHCKTISYKKYRELNIACNDIRFINGTTVKNGGWHLSYFGDTNFIKNKLENFAHQEYNSSTFTDTDKISEKINKGLDLFNRDANNVSESIQKISISDNKYLPPFFETYLKEFYDNLDPNATVKPNNIIGFHSNQLCERGTEVAMYDYAYYNQKLYGNKSIIFYCKHNNNDANVIHKFEKEFICYAYDNFSDIDNIILDEKIDYFYNIKSGTKSDNQIVTKCPNLIHAVFTVDPHGEKYATVSKQLSSKYNNIVDYVPHMINLPICNNNIRIQLNIAENAIVLGRIGGFYQFDIEIAHNAIKKIVELDPNIFFLFVNTNKFYEHPQIIYLDKIIDPIQKVTFINTCDAMIHARSDGETFGLSIAEFSSLNKAVITSVSKIDNSHIEILGSKGIIYDTEESLMEIFKNIRTIINSNNDWNAYKEYTPERVMKKFMDVFIK